jgi:hypothetical protein
MKKRVANGGSLSEKDRLELKEKRWQNIVTLIGIGLTFTGTVLSLVWNAHTAGIVEGARIESGNVTSNANDTAHPWIPWWWQVSQRTVGIGLKREVKFSRPFQRQPRVTVALSAMDYPNLTSVFADFGPVPQDAEWKESLRKVNITSQVDRVSNEGFELQVGIGLRTPVAERLRDQLIKKPNMNTSDPGSVAVMRNFGQLQNRLDALTGDEIWMVNFYRIIGTFDVTWIAQTDEKTSKPADQSH